MGGFSALLSRDYMEIEKVRQAFRKWDYYSWGDREIIMFADSKKENFFGGDKRYRILFEGRLFSWEKPVQNISPDLSDPEIVLFLYKKLGREMFSKLRGMYSFLIWDANKKELFGARDFFGIKPLFYIQTAKGLFFSTRKENILNFIEDAEPDLKVLQHYLSFQYPPEPRSMHRGVKKIPRKTFLSRKKGAKEPGFFEYSIPQIKYYSPQKEEEIFESIKTVLDKSVYMHLKGEKKTGAFLSSGIDSTAIVSLAKKYKPDIKTFTSGFDCKGYNEKEIAQATAEKLGVENYSVVISVEDIMENLKKIVGFLGEPLADPAAIPLYFVSKKASKKVQAVLSGEGADELFGGYNIYREPNDLRFFSMLPGFCRGVLQKISHLLPEGVKGKDFIRRGLQPIEKRYYGNARIFREEEKPSFFWKYDPTVSHYDITHPIYEKIRGAGDIEKMQQIDLNTWLPGDILLKGNRMTQVNGLELRSPFLDMEVFQVANSIPSHLKIRGKTTKFALRQALKNVVPSSVIDRKKLGYPVPIRIWLRKEMYSWAEEIIKDSPTDYLFNKKEILKFLEKHRKKQGDYSRKIWTILVFMIWHQIFIEES